MPNQTKQKQIKKKSKEKDPKEHLSKEDGGLTYEVPEGKLEALKIL